MANIRIRGTKAPKLPPCPDAPPPVPKAYAMSIKIITSFGQQKFSIFNIDGFAKTRIQ
jgi:hypothetical protein